MLKQDLLKNINFGQVCRTKKMPSKIKRFNYKNKQCKQKIYIYKDDIKRKNILNKSHTYITCKRCGVVCGSLILQSTPKRKKRYTDRAFASKKKKKGASEEEHAAIGLYMRFYQSLSFLNFSLSLFLKTEFLFGKTNRVKFHEKFLTPYIFIYET